MLNLGTLTIDPTKHTTVCNGERIELTQCEQRILESLVSNIGKAVSQAVLLDLIKNISAEQRLIRKNVQVHVCRLRAKIAKANNGIHYIGTLGDCYTAYESRAITALTATL